jgi:transcriptional regulator with XRE-family HTH domain
MNQEKLNELLRGFLIKKREDAGLSQSDVAARSDVFGMEAVLDQRTVSRIEQQPITADAIKIAGYLSAVGVPPQQYYDFLTELTYKNDEGVMKLSKENIIAAKLSIALENVSKAKSLIALDHEYIQSLKLLDSFEQIGNILKSLDRKPVIGFFGHFDAGKSTLINTVINQDVLPAKYQPATCVVNLLMHIEDKPSSISGSVALFKKGFKPYMIHDKKIVDEYLIEEGDTKILDRLGVHNYDNENLMYNDAYLAIVFSAADILRHVWLLDTPGDLNSADDSDTEKALGGVEIADSIVFISTHTAFFKDSDLGFAANIIRQKPPTTTDDAIKHLLFIQSHCHSEISPEAISSVGLTAFKRIKKQLDKLIFEEWIKDKYIDIAPSPDQLTSRVQPFWRENEVLRKQTLSKIQDMAEYLVHHQESMASAIIERTMKQLSTILLNAVGTLESRKQDTFNRMRRVEEQDARFRQESKELIEQFNSLIESCSSRKSIDIESMNHYFKVKTSVEGVAEIIHETYDDKKDAQSEIGNYVSQLLSTKLESLLKTSGKTISNEVDELLSKWQKAASFTNNSEIDIDTGTLDFNVSAFNSRAAFIGGLAGLGSLGAMSLYVSTIASNLGAYILVGKAAGVLVSLGLVGSVTTVTSFVAAIGGPITIGIALAALIGYVMYRLTGGSWQVSLAKKVSEAIKKENVWHKIEKPITSFWDSTEKAISAGLNELIIQTDEYIKSLKLDADISYDILEIDDCISTIESAVDSIKANIITNDNFVDAS